MTAPPSSVGRFFHVLHDFFITSNIGVHFRKALTSDKFETHNTNVF